MKRHKDWLWLLALVCLAALYSSFFSHPRLAADWSKPFNVDGIVLGMTRDQVQALKGKPDQNLDDVFAYGGGMTPDVSALAIHFGVGPVVTMVSGNALYQGQQRLLMVNFSTPPEPVLGKPTDTRIGKRRDVLGGKPAGSAIKEVEWLHKTPYLQSPYEVRIRLTFENNSLLIIELVEQMR